MKKACAFCGNISDLRESHIIPAFVFRWLRTRSGKGHIRNTGNPNRRIQDGPKLYLLCDACENQFSRYETAFAKNVFHPWHAGNYQISYSDWLLKFCVSISWRVLKFCRGRNKDAQYTDEQQSLMDGAELRWRCFLRDEVPHPGEFEQHLLIGEIIQSSRISELPNNFNRFITGAVTLDIVGSNRSLMTFAKLGRFMIFGQIQKGPSKWEGTKVHVKHGMLKPGKFTVPVGVLDLLRAKAAHALSAIESTSPPQRRKIENNILDNLEQFAESEQFASILADIEMFGEDAVIWKEQD